MYVCVRRPEHGEGTIRKLQRRVKKGRGGACEREREREGGSEGEREGERERGRE